MPSPRTADAGARTAPAAEAAPAKINLCLHVTGRRADGYHLLDSLVAFADLSDFVSVGEAPAPELTVTGPEAAGVPLDDGNSVLRAARLMGAAVAIRLEKHLPNQAGIGGGSSDAAAALRAIARMTGQPIPDGTESLGADVPVCLVPTAARMRGIGEEITRVPLPPLPAVLVNPRRSVPTPMVFAALASRHNPPMPESLPQMLSAEAAIGFLAQQRNDLEPAARQIAPEIGAALAALGTHPETRLARMSGSGATCFGLYDTPEAARRAAAAILSLNPGWWVRAVTLG